MMTNLEIFQFGWKTVKLAQFDPLWAPLGPPRHPLGAVSCTLGMPDVSSGLKYVFFHLGYDKKLKSNQKIPN